MTPTQQVSFFDGVVFGLMILSLPYALSLPFNFILISIVWGILIVAYAVLRFHIISRFFCLALKKETSELLSLQVKNYQLQESGERLAHVLREVCAACEREECSICTLPSALSIWTDAHKNPFNSDLVTRK